MNEVLELKGKIFDKIRERDMLSWQVDKITKEIEASIVELQKMEASQASKPE